MSEAGDNMLNLVRKGLDFKFVTLSTSIQSEFLVDRATGDILTNPLESIINCIANIEDLTVIANVLSIEPSLNNLEELFDTINLVYYQYINKFNMIA